MRIAPIRPSQALFISFFLVKTASNFSLHHRTGTAPAAVPREPAPCVPCRPRPAAALRRPRPVAAAAAEPAAAPSSSEPSAAPAPTDFHIRSVTAADYWAVADVHCEAFYPKSGPFWAPLLRLDRVVGLQVGYERESVQRAGRVEALVAVSESENDWEVMRGPDRPPSLGFLMDALATAVLPPGMRENYAARHAAAGVLGAVVIDTFLEHVPPRRGSSAPGGVVQETPRRGMAYLSNLAVAPAARRRGLGAALVARALEAAAGWGCRSVALHVDPSNVAAVELYQRAGFRAVARQPEWQRMVEGRATALLLMLAVLPRRRAAAGGEEAEGDAAAAAE